MFICLSKRWWCLRQRLGFVRTAKRVAKQWFAEEMERQVVEALRRAGFKTNA